MQFFSKTVLGFAVLCGGLTQLVQPASAGTILSSADTYITQYTALGGPNSNHGGDASLWIEGLGGQTGIYATIPLVQFNLSAFAGQTVLGAPVVSLFLKDAGGAGDAVTQTIDLHQSLVAWQENTATWNNFGGSGFQTSDAGPTLSTRVVNWGSDKFTYVSWTVPASVVQSWIDNSGNNKGLFFFGSTPNGSTDLLFSSKEGANAPQLTFQTASVPLPKPAAVGLILLGGLGLISLTRRRFSLHA